jgi:hypothetical protein
VDAIGRPSGADAARGSRFNALLQFACSKSRFYRDAYPRNSVNPET